jgi:hypothetical protein
MMGIVTVIVQNKFTMSSNRRADCLPNGICSRLSTAEDEEARNSFWRRATWLRTHQRGGWWWRVEHCSSVCHLQQKYPPKTMVPGGIAKQHASALIAVECSTVNAEGYTDDQADHPESYVI